MISTLTEIVLIITGFQLILLVVVLLAQKGMNRRSRNLLVAFLLSKVFLVFRWLAYHFTILKYEGSPYFYHLSSAVFFLLAPLLYFYIKSLCYKDFRIGTKTVLHFLPFIGILVFKIISLHLLLSGAAAPGSFAYRVFIAFHGNIFWGGNLFQIVFYIVLMLGTVRGYQNRLQTIYSTVERINLQWLYMLLMVIILHWVFVTSRAILSVVNPQAETLLSLIDLFSITIFLVFTTILVFKGLNQLKVFSGIEEKAKYATSRLTEQEIEKYAGELIRYMKTRKPYLEPTLTIEGLSHELSLPGWELSRVINDYFHQNFFNFVNSFRIEEAKRLLSDSSDGKRTVLEVLYEVGFNSKSAFNLAFKKHTGMTPTEFKNKMTRPSSPRPTTEGKFRYKKRPAL